VKTVVQIVAITLYVLPLGSGGGGLRFAALLAAVAFTMVTGLQYVAAALGPADKTPKEAAR
jgi:phosphatidylglycerophosphate synthase